MDVEPTPAEFVEQLLMHDVDLSKIWLGGVLGDAGAVLHGHASVRITNNTVTGSQRDGIDRNLREAVLVIEADPDDPRCWTSTPLNH